jgi:2,3-bisphosphoglycerate-dependent phosphoglycerate mutase
MIHRLGFCFLLLNTLLASALAQSTVFVVRHAEKADGTKDPDLSEAGRARADALSKTLKDAKITAIYATEFKRTQQTGAPVAKALGLSVTTLPASDNAALATKLRGAKGSSLVIGHGNTIPDLIKALGSSEQINIADNDYDNLFVVLLDEKPRLIRLHYP